MGVDSGVRPDHSLLKRPVVAEEERARGGGEAEKRLEGKKNRSPSITISGGKANRNYEKATYEVFSPGQGWGTIKKIPRQVRGGRGGGGEDLQQDPRPCCSSAGRNPKRQPYGPEATAARGEKGSPPKSRTPSRAAKGTVL